MGSHFFIIQDVAKIDGVYYNSFFLAQEYHNKKRIKWNRLPGCYSLPTMRWFGIDRQISAESTVFILSLGCM